MKPYRGPKNTKSSLDVRVEPPQSLQWVVREREDLELELNSPSSRSPDVTEGLINRVMKRIEDL
ncbi:MAG: hypothetical protein R6U51_04215 [Anaerolineales bacterium]